MKFGLSAPGVHRLTVLRSVLTRGLAAAENVTRAFTWTTAVRAGSTTLNRRWFGRARSVRTGRPLTTKATAVTWPPVTVTVNRRSTQLRGALNVARADTTRAGDTACCGPGVVLPAAGGGDDDVTPGDVPPAGGAPPPPPGGDAAVSVNVHALCSSGLSSTVADRCGTSTMNGSCGSGGVATQSILVTVQPGSASCVTVKSPWQSGTTADSPSWSVSVTSVGGRNGHVGP